MEYEEKRKHSRQPLLVLADYATQGHAYQDFIQDISSDGVFLETPLAFSIGQELSLTFTLPDQQKHVKIVGEVARISPQGIGVKFKTASQHELKAEVKQAAERRKHKRFQLQVSAFALLNKPFYQMGEIIDISKGGLSFQYNADKSLPMGSFVLDILCVDDRSSLRKVPFNAVSELKLSSTARRLGVQFRKLTNKQSSQLKWFIQTHTAGGA